jgi:tRNA threonylcarbamoyladenosine biosynthesis protein TsaB
VSNLGPFIVAIDTSTRRGSVAIARGRRLVAHFGVDSDAQQSIELWDTVDMLLLRAGTTIRDVAAFATSRGPGSFTGLRVGLTAALGFARTLGRPLYGATSLELTARSTGACDDLWVLLNAHRKEVYAQRFRVDSAGGAEPLSHPEVAPPESVIARVGPGPVRFAGDGAELYRETIAAAAAGLGGLDEPGVIAPVGRRWQLAPAHPFLAGDLALAAAGWLEAGLDPGRVEPCYIRPSEAEINLRLGRLGIPGGGGR